MRDNIFDLVFLYLGRTIGLLVGFIALPLYREYLGEHDFGLVIIYLTCSAIAVMLDLGLATFINREVASSQNQRENYSKLISCEVIFLFSFVIAILGLLLISQYVESDIGNTAIFLASFSILMNVINNFYSYLWLGCREYKLAGSIQGSAAMLKASFAILTLSQISSTLEAFFISQVLSVLIVNAYSRIKITNRLGELGDFWDNIDLTFCLRILRKTLPILLFSISGAAVLQLDKIIVSNFSGIEFVSNYYLAMTLSMLPITVFAAPIAQFFQPKVVLYINDEIRFGKTVKHYIISITIISFLTTWVLYLFREPLITAWLGASDNALVVIDYVAIMLPGIFLGSLGFVPSSILIAKEKYKLQAKVSIFLTLATLSFVLYFASMKSVAMVCMTYAAYHALSSVFSWGASVLSSRRERVNILGLFGLQSLLALCCILFFI